MTAETSGRVRSMWCNHPSDNGHGMCVGRHREDCGCECHEAGRTPSLDLHHYPALDAQGRQSVLARCGAERGALIQPRWSLVTCPECKPEIAPGRVPS